VIPPINRQQVTIDRSGTPRAIASRVLGLSIFLSGMAAVTIAAPTANNGAATPVSHPINSGLNNRDITISPDGKTLYTSVTSPKNDHAVILESHLKNGRWSEPELAPFSGTYPDIEPMYSPDGEQLFFASKRPKTDLNGTDWDIWFMTSTANGWSAPINAGASVNSDGDEFYPSVAANGNLYFTATRADGEGSEDIYVARRNLKTIDVIKFEDASPVPGKLNTKTYEFNAFIAPDESYLIFGSQGREDEIGGGDLYISYRQSNGDFGDGVLLPETVNSNKLDYCPYVWQQTFFFTSERRSKLDHIDSAKSMKYKFNSPGNGLGDIYGIELEQVLPPPGIK